MKFRILIAIASLAFVFGGSLPTVWAQSGTSSVQGTVTDSTGAVVPDSDVTLTNNATGVNASTKSDSAGSYSFPVVVPGLYTLEVTRSGFAGYQIKAFSVIVGQHETQNAKLSVASSATTVTVDASGLSNVLDTESNDLGGVIGPRSVENLPLNGRNFLQLSLLSGAAVTPQGAAAGSTNQTGHPLLAINVAGNEPDYTMYVVNGIEAVGSRAGNTSLNIDTGAIDQFEVHYGFFMPDMGPNPGIVDVVRRPAPIAFMVKFMNTCGLTRCRPATTLRSMPARICRFLPENITRISSASTSAAPSCTKSFSISRAMKAIARTSKC